MSFNFYFSEYPECHPLYSVANAKVVGKFKSETSHLPIVEFIGLRPNMYSILLPDDQHYGWTL